MAHVLLVNPRGRKRRAGKKVHRPAPRRNPRRTGAARRSRRHLRRNPFALRLGGARSGGLVGNLTHQATGAGLGLAGAIVTDVLMKPMPLEMKAGPIGHITRAGLAIALGLLGAKRPMVAQAANGALTVALYQAYAQYLKGQLHLGEYTEGDMQEMMGAYEAAGVPSLGVSDTPPVGLGAYDYDYAR